MKAIVASQRHGLLPFAWRLKKEGVDVKTIVWRDRYEQAWSGITDKALVGTEKNRDSLALLVEEAKDAETVVLADSMRGMATFKDATHLFGHIDTPTEIVSTFVGGWFDGDKFVPNLTHLLVVDMGLWPGGLGPFVPGGATLVRAPAMTDLLTRPIQPLGTTQPAKSRVDRLRGEKCRGLVRVPLVVTAEGRLVLGEAELGWSHIHAHAFLSELSSFSSLLFGGTADLEQQYVVVAPLTVPPYPTGGQNNAIHQRVGGLTDDHIKHIFFHDFLAKEGNEVWVAGLDGFVGVVRGAGASLPLAQQRCLSILQDVQLHEKQARPDIATQVDTVLGLIEELGVTPVVTPVVTST